MILLVAALAAAGATVASARDWAVHTDNADELADAHNLENLGEVLPNSKIYHLAMRGSEHTQWVTLEFGAIWRKNVYDPTCNSNHFFFFANHIMLDFTVG